jgi:hypothetical protein
VKVSIALALAALTACQDTKKKESPSDPSTLRSEGPVSRMEPADAGPVAVKPPVPDEPAEDRPPPPPLPDPLPGKRTDLTGAVGKAWRAVIGDLDGDGKREIVTADSSAFHVLDATGKEITSTPVTSGILQLIAADLDGDKRTEVYAGWGQTRDHMDGTARITLHRIDKGKLVEELVLAPTTSRQEVVALVPMPDTHELFAAYFDSKYMVSSVVLTRSGSSWTSKPVTQLRTATSYARGDVDGDGKPDLIVGRVYGDDKGIDGDAFELGPDGTRTKIPSTRGLRSVAVADSDGDGKAEVFMGDGWHQNYGQHAHGLLTWAKASGGTFTTQLVEDTAGQYELMRILPAKIDGKFALVTLGSHYVRVFYKDGAGFKGLTIAGASRDIAVGDMDGKPGDEIVILGDKSELVNLAGALK